MLPHPEPKRVTELLRVSMPEKTTSKKPTWRHRFLPPAAALFVRGLHATYRIAVHDPSGFLERQQPWPGIVVAWHNRLLMLPAFFPRQGRRKCAALASISRDGQYAADYMRQFGMQAVRGSTSRGGLRALNHLKACLFEGISVAMTPDGPRGPRYTLQSGAVMLAQKTGAPIIPVSANAVRRWEFGGWDRTQIPKPFARVDLMVGRPVYVPQELTQDEREQQRQLVEQALMSITAD